MTELRLEDGWTILIAFSVEFFDVATRARDTALIRQDNEKS